MLPYTGSGAYCYANSLHMALRGALMPTADLPDPATLECLTTMPFGSMVLVTETDTMYFPNNPCTEPDAGLSLAIRHLGWACDEHHGGTSAEALIVLRKALAYGPVLVGPVDMGYLSYMPDAESCRGSDHFIVVIAMDDERVRVHDPQGYPCATLPIDHFIRAGQAESISYGRKLVMRSNFHQADNLTRTQVIKRALPAIRDGLRAKLEGPEVFGGTAALTYLINDLHSTSPQMGELVAVFSFQLGARRSLDAAGLLHEAGLNHAADLMSGKAMLYGEAQYPAAQRNWSAAAAVIEQMLPIERALIDAL
jgi:hypothetical protein